jgi:endonuclease/exonuclease/phosphatase family metal-dependent hydrolase
MPNGWRQVVWLLLVVVAWAWPVATQATPATQSPIRVMSFNVRFGAADDGVNAWEHRQELLVQTIGAFAPDLLGIQECLFFQAEYLQERLPGFGMVGVGRDDGKQAGEMCPIFFKQDRFAKLAEGHFWLSPTPAVPGSRGWDADLPRMVSWVRLQLRGSAAQSLYCFNTHFDHAGPEARRQAAGLLRERALSLGAGDPLVICGDFNAPAEAGPISPWTVLLVGSDQETPNPDPVVPLLLDTFQQMPAGADQPVGTYHGFTGQASGARIDWILVSTHWTVLAAGIDRTQWQGRFPSDHFPVTAIVALPVSSNPPATP